MSPRSFFVRRDYDTLLDRFRRKEGIPLLLWAEEAGMNRTQLGKYRSGKLEPSAVTLSDLVRAAKRIIGCPVKASDLYDLGEDEPLNVTNPYPWGRPQSSVRQSFNTRLDRCLIRERFRHHALLLKLGSRVKVFSESDQVRNHRQ